MGASPKVGRPGRLTQPVTSSRGSPLYIAGLAAAADGPGEVFVEGPAFGSISMTSYALGADCPPSTDSQPAAFERSATAPPEETNL